MRTAVPSLLLVLVLAAPGCSRDAPPDTGGVAAGVGGAVLPVLDTGGAGELERRLGELDDALSVGDETGPVQNARGVALAQMGRFDEARKAFESARIQSDPAFGGRAAAPGAWQGHARHNLGLLQLLEGHADVALTALDAAHADGEADQRVNTALAAFVLGSDDRAVGDLTAALREAGGADAVAPLIGSGQRRADGVALFDLARRAYTAAGVALPAVDPPPDGGVALASLVRWQRASRRMPTR